MKTIHIDLMFGHTPIKGTVTIVESTKPVQQAMDMQHKEPAPREDEEIRRNEAGQRLASDSQEYVLQKANLWREGMTAQEAYIMIRDYKAGKIPKGKPEEKQYHCTLCSEPHPNHTADCPTINMRKASETQAPGNTEPLPWEDPEEKPKRRRRKRRVRT